MAALWPMICLSNPGTRDNSLIKALMRGGQCFAQAGQLDGQQKQHGQLGRVGFGSRQRPISGPACVYNTPWDSRAREEPMTLQTEMTLWP